MKENVIEICRRFRKEATSAEKKFWQHVRNQQIYCQKFLRQYPIFFEWNDEKRFFIADFYNHKAKLVIEIDGGIHETQKDYDKLREQIINKLGIKVIRF